MTQSAAAVAVAVPGSRFETNWQEELSTQLLRLMQTCLAGGALAVCRFFRE